MELLIVVGLLALFGATLYGFTRLTRVSDTEDIRDHLTTDPAHEALAEEILAVEDAAQASDEKGKPIGYRVRHDTARSRVVVIPIMSKPYTKKSTGQLMPFMCPTCRIAHPVKSVHLWLDDTGSAIVSKGVLDELRSAGMPELVNEGLVRNPPPLKAGHGVSRAEIDQDNRKIVQYKVV